MDKLAEAIIRDWSPYNIKQVERQTIVVHWWSFFYGLYTELSDQRFIKLYIYRKSKKVTMVLAVFPSFYTNILLSLLGSSLLFSYSLSMLGKSCEYGKLVSAKIIIHKRIFISRTFPGNWAAQQRHNVVNLKQIIPEKELRGLSHNFHIHVCERLIYSYNRSAYSAAGKYVDRSWEYINI
jgi:hypothetical protein